ncbi:hypothetical protein FCM35_KLT00308 [Carex littledalei]|uniref:Uncharacterized protein n=1 Tax=Carex littledalei TaxID=544730 RepID=A0A833VTH2_9POAL|nr:hypothetical protein FCM35_KLT00308 [Carex littledalei]
MGRSLGKRGMAAVEGEEQADLLPGQQTGDSLQQRMDALRPHAPFDMEQLMIYRLPKFLHHDGNKALFEPSTISIGPYYHGRSNLCVMEEYKLRYLRDFLSRNPERHDSHELLVNNFTNLFLAQETLGPPLILRGKIHHLLHLYHELFVPRLESRCKSYQSNKCFPSLKILEEGNYRKKLVIPCATRLHEAGVKFHYKRSYEHKFDIKFNRGVRYFIYDS